jgi:hypothetical protein
MTAKSKEYSAFETALRKVLQVPHSEMQARIKAAKCERARNRQRKQASGPASRARD